jgi:ssRNA-specific RNase YbeY (16S rRNA maturation enzyme)
LLLYVVHALLHCLGHDDHEEQAAEAMHRMEDAVLESIGVGPVFRVPEH